MWRDSFAVPRYLDDNRPVSRTFDDAFLLNVERQAGHLRRTDSSSFIRVTGDAGQTIPLRDALERGYKADVTEDMNLLAQTPIDKSLPSVKDMFVHFSGTTAENDTSSVFQTNPLVPPTPPRRRKTGTFVGLLKALHISRDEVSDNSDTDRGIIQANLSMESPRAETVPEEESTKKTSSISVESMSRSSSLKHTESSESDSTLVSAAPSTVLGDQLEQLDDPAENAGPGRKRRMTRVLKKSLSYVMTINKTDQ